MKDYLQDLITHIQGFESVETIKIVGNDKETKIYANASNKTVVIMGQFKKPVPEFIGTFGMPNLGKLRTILGIDEYDEGANISVVTSKKDKEDVPSAIHFECKTGDFVNDYRLMGGHVVVERVKIPTQVVQITFNVEFTPTISAIQRLKKQASANAEEVTFVTKLDGSDLKVYFGDHSSHSGNFVFEANIAGKLARAWAWPIKQVLAILSLAGDKTFKISDQGLCEIVVDSGLATYTYRLPAQQK